MVFVLVLESLLFLVFVLALPYICKEVSPLNPISSISMELLMVSNSPDIQLLVWRDFRIRIFSHKLMTSVGMENCCCQFAITNTVNSRRETSGPSSLFQYIKMSTTMKSCS